MLEQTKLTRPAVIASNVAQQVRELNVTHFVGSATSKRQDMIDTGASVADRLHANPTDAAITPPDIGKGDTLSAAPAHPRSTLMVVLPSPFRVLCPPRTGVRLPSLFRRRPSLRSASDGASLPPYIGIVPPSLQPRPVNALIRLTVSANACSVRAPIASNTLQDDGSIGAIVVAAFNQYAVALRKVPGMLVRLHLLAMRRGVGAIIASLTEPLDQSALCWAAFGAGARGSRLEMHNDSPRCAGPRAVSAAPRPPYVHYRISGFFDQIVQVARAKAGRQ